VLSSTRIGQLRATVVPQHPTGACANGEVAPNSSCQV
jgi:hypothetical protein